MKQNVLTLLGVVIVLAGIVTVRTAFHQTVQTEAEDKAAREAEEDLAKAAEITEKAEAEAPPATETPAEAAPPAETPATGTEEAVAPAPVEIAGFEEIPWADKAPDVFRVKFDTSVGPFVVECHRDWAPLGADRFYDMCKNGFFDGARYFRVIHGFMVQFGLAADPKMSARYAENNLMDEPVLKSNLRGKITFAKSGMPNSRSSQVFINYGDNSRLDADGFAPFGEVIYGMENVDKITDQYGEQPNQGQIRSRGNEYLNQRFPELDYTNKVTLVK